MSLLQWSDAGPRVASAAKYANSCNRNDILEAAAPLFWLLGFQPINQQPRPFQRTYPINAMSDSTTASDEDPIRRETVSLVAEIKGFRDQAEEELKAVQASRKRADDDASYANQAKINTEEHSKATAIYKGTAEADLNSVATNKKNFDELVANVTIGKATIEAHLKSALEGQKEIEQAAIKLRGSSEAGELLHKKIDDLRIASVALQQDAEKARDNATQAQAKALGAQTEAEKSSSKINELMAVITEQGSSSSKELAQVREEAEKIKTAKTSIDQIIDGLRKSDQISGEHITKLSELETKLDALNKRAESLLPGMTSASLAHSFNLRGGTFTGPQKRWLNIFVFCLMGLVLVAAPSFYLAVFGDAKAMDWEEILRGVVMRLPIVVPFVWLAIYAGRNYMLSLRLEEDYAYKEAISRAFEGYKREMDKIEAGDAENPTPLTKLCLNVLTAMAERPGRIYESKQKDLTLMNEAAELLEQVDELRKKHVNTH